MQLFHNPGGSTVSFRATVNWTLCRRNFDIFPRTIFRFAQTAISRQCGITNSGYSARFVTKSIAIVVHVHAHATSCERSRRRWPTPRKLTRQKKIAQHIISQIRKLFVLPVEQFNRQHDQKEFHTQERNFPENV